MMPAVMLSTHVMGLAAIRALGKTGMPVIAAYYKKEDFGYVSIYTKDKLFTPHPERNKEELIDMLLEYAEFIGQCLLSGTIGIASPNSYKSFIA
jgi:hypothetical protein